MNDQLLDRVASGDTFTSSDISDTGGASDPERSLLRSYVPLGSSVVAEVDQSDAGTVAIARTEWRYYQLLAGGLVVLFLVIAALSLRDPVEPINAGVPFAASSIREGYSLIDDERLHAVNEVYRLSNERVSNLQTKLSPSPRRSGGTSRGRRPARPHQGRHERDATRQRREGSAAGRRARGGTRPSDVAAGGPRAGVRRRPAEAARRRLGRGRRGRTLRARQPRSEAGACHRQAEGRGRPEAQARASSPAAEGEEGRGAGEGPPRRS